MLKYGSDHISHKFILSVAVRNVLRQRGYNLYKTDSNQLLFQFEGQSVKKKKKVFPMRFSQRYNTLSANLRI